MADPQIVVEGTPNPNAAKFVVRDADLGTVSRSYFDPEEAADDVLAGRLFRIEGVRALLIVDNFVTVTKADEVEWDDILGEITWTIGEALGA